MTSKIAVIDASIVIKAILPNPLQGHCQALVQTFADVQPIAPALWVYETTSAISKAVYFEPLTANEGDWALEQVDALGVQLFFQILRGIVARLVEHWNSDAARRTTASILFSHKPSIVTFEPRTKTIQRTNGYTVELVALERRTYSVDLISI